MKRGFLRLRDFFVWVVLLGAVVVMVGTVCSVALADRNERSLFGYRAFIVRSDSMQATDFGAGDVIFVRQTDPATLREGDIITYISRDPASYGETVTHKIRALTMDVDGTPGFITYGTTTDTDDAVAVTYPYVLGRYIGKLAGVGRFLAFVKTVPGHILFVLLPLLLALGWQTHNCIRLVRSRNGDQDT